MKQKFLAALMSFLAISPVFAARSPAETVSGFYSLRFEKGSSGVPGGLELAAFSEYLAPELVCMLGAAMRYTDQYSKALPDKKPPLSDGDLYSSSTQMIPSRFKLGSPSGSASKTEIGVHFFRDEAAQGGAADWEDIVHVSLRRKRWLISDIEYHGNFPDAARGSLMASLRETLTHPEEASQWDPRELSACTIETGTTQRASARKLNKQKAKKSGKSASSGSSKTKKAVSSKRSATTHKKPASTAHTKKH